MVSEKVGNDLKQNQQVCDEKENGKCCREYVPKREEVVCHIFS
ncbi:hypothetical protein FORC065_2212 [Yersinia enterocolitica]|nr:hypothetical protein FORC065_2212 [Yersinia enterocolitica]